MKAKTLEGGRKYAVEITILLDVQKYAVKIVCLSNVSAMLSEDFQAEVEYQSLHAELRSILLNF